MDYLRMRLRPRFALVLTLLLVAANCYFYFVLFLPQSRHQSLLNAMDVRYSYGGDFYPIWLTGRALLANRGDRNDSHPSTSDRPLRDPYTQAATRNIQIGLYGRPMDASRPSDPPPEYRAFSYPLYTDLLAAPLLPMSFEAVRVLLTVLLVPLTAASVIIWQSAFRIEIPRSQLAIFMSLTLVSYPVLEGLYALQAGLLVSAAMALSIYALTRNRLVLSGVLLALASVKPQVMWLLAFFLLLWTLGDWGRRKSLAVSFVLTMTLLWLASDFFLPGWFSGWWHAAVRYSGYTLPPLPQLVLGQFLGSAVALALLAVVAAICWRARLEPTGSSRFSLAVCFVLAVAAMLLPTGGAVYDQIVLMPAIFWLWSRRERIRHAGRPARVLGLAAVLTLCWQWVMAGGVALLSLLWPGWARTPKVLVFPTRMAASLPFALIALLLFFAVPCLRGRAIDDEPALTAANPA